MHEEIDKPSKDHTANDRPLHQQRKPATRKVINRGRADRDDEMKHNSENDGWNASFVCTYSENSSSNVQRNQQRMMRTVDNHCIEEIDHSSDDAPHENS